MSDKIVEELTNEIESLAEESIGEIIEVGINDKILEKGILDSPAIISLIVFIEKKYKITIEQDEMDIKNFESINKIEKLIKNKMG